MKNLLSILSSITLVTTGATVISTNLPINTENTTFSISTQNGVASWKAYATQPQNPDEWNRGIWKLDINDYLTQDIVYSDASITALTDILNSANVPTDASVLAITLLQIDKGQLEAANSAWNGVTISFEGWNGVISIIGSTHNWG